MCIVLILPIVRIERDDETECSGPMPAEIINIRDHQSPKAREAARKALEEHTLEQHAADCGDLGVVYAHSDLKTYVAPTDDPA